jgi:hypothetical protein
MVKAKLIVFQKCVLKYPRTNVLERFISCGILYGRVGDFQTTVLELGEAEH